MNVTLKYGSIIVFRVSYKVNLHLTQMPQIQLHSSQLTNSNYTKRD